MTRLRSSVTVRMTFVPEITARRHHRGGMNSSTRLPVVVGVDGSDSSVEALRYGARMAAALGAPLRAIIAWDYPTLMDVYTNPEWKPGADAASTLETSIRMVFAIDPPVDMTAVIIAGPPAASLIDESRNAEMLVLGSRGRGGFASLVLGSVSSTCVVHAHCPVLVVHRRTESGGA